MHRYKKIILILILLCCTIFVIGANQNFPKVGVINIKKISQTYFKNSKSLRDLESEKERNTKYIEQIMEEIKELEGKILEAKMNNDNDSVRRYELEKDKKTEHLREYTRISNQRIDEKMKKLYYSDTFMNELIDAINSVSFKNGFSLVLDVNAGNIYFYTPEIDITDIVIEELMKNK
ncbi:MAG: OmpH family outer membrane protein [Spirochaetales bacterium]|nr:OmpH family outer membrane protein [Spirochaetales bacterium]